MAESNQADEPRQDPADALADMASTQPPEIAPPEDEPGAPADPQDALNELAEGRRQQPDPGEVLTAEPVEELDREIAEATGLAGAQAVQARRAQAARIGGRQARAQYHHYKRTMIPLLIVVGALLLVVGVCAALLLVYNRSRGGGSHDTALALVTIVSFPLAGILALGAWWFHKEVQGR
jgi:hypothetical protein